MAANMGSDESAEFHEEMGRIYAQAIEARREEIKAGNGDALLAAIMDVVKGRIAFPEWLSYEVAAAIRRYTHHEVSTLDDAFRVKRPSGYRRKAVRDRWQKSIPIINDIHELNQHGFPIDDNMFDEVGRLHGVGKTTASKWYYWHKNNKTSTFIAFSQPQKNTSLSQRLKGVADVLGKLRST